MATREDLQTKLEELLGSRNVYYNPPTNLRMEYDCVRYSLNNFDIKYADDKKYSKMNKYDLIVISRESDPEVVDKILELRYASLNTSYVSDNLNHYSITLYW